jgi:hypothetical protein
MQALDGVPLPGGKNYESEEMRRINSFALLARFGAEGFC